jgi:hypothetical protein
MPLHEKRQFRLVRWMTTKSDPLLLLNLLKVALKEVELFYDLFILYRSAIGGTSRF